MKIEWTDAAKLDAKQIFEYWNNRNKSFKYCRKLAKQFKEAVNVIKQFPFDGRETNFKITSVF